MYHGGHPDACCIKDDSAGIDLDGEAAQFIFRARGAKGHGSGENQEKHVKKKEKCQKSQLETLRHDLPSLSPQQHLIRVYETELCIPSKRMVLVCAVADCEKV
jgi:hypothetical protein